jgi:hypothetical protein
MLKIIGLDEFQRKLNDFAQRAATLSGTQNIPLPELLTPDFLRGCSHFESADALFAASGFKVDTPEDFAAIPDAAWDDFICANTTFAAWDEMLGKAGGEWAARRLDL